MIEKKRKIERERGKDRDVIKERERQGKEGKTKRVRKGQREIDKCYKGKRNGDKDR